MYQIFDTCLNCEFPLPELPASKDGDYAFSVRMGSSEQFRESDFSRAFEWPNESGNIVCWCSRRGDEYLFCFPGHASYHVSADAVISCWVEEGSTVGMMRQLLLNQIVPRCLATSGRLVLHASAVSLKNGRTIAFLGNSGFGKSTLASSFHRHGARLISDDSILLKPGKDRVTAIGGFPGIRLFPDSVNAVFDESTGFTNYTPYSSKQQLILKKAAKDDPPQPVALDALFLIEDPQKVREIEEVAIEPLSASQAFMAMITCSFSLDPSDRKMITSNFKNAASSIDENLGLYQLSYPRVHDRLPELREAITARVSA